MMRRASGRLPVLFLLLVAPAVGDEVDNLDYLRALPPERRAQLASALAAFDQMPPDQKAAIRDLNAKIEALPDEASRASYLEVLRSYHLWRRTLTEAERKAIDDMSPSLRVKKVNELRKAQVAKAKREIANRPDWIQVSTLNELPLFWTALHLKIWFLLTDDQRDTLKRIENRDQRTVRLQQFGRQLKAPGEFRHFEQEFQAEIDKAEGMRDDLALIEAKKKVKEKTERKKAFPPNPPKTASANTRKVEANFLRVHKSLPVDKEHLKQFEEECPIWLQESLEPLPPDAAQRRLAILYRMVFHAPDEIPPPKVKPKPPKPPADPHQPGAETGIR